MSERETEGSATVPSRESEETLRERIKGFGATVLALSWKPEHRARSLEELFRIADAVGSSAVEYYERKSRWKRTRSRFLRTAAIVFGAGGVLVPLVVTAWEANPARASWGYVCFAAAGVSIGADRLYGLSSGWIRFVTSNLTLERALRRFRFEWALLQSHAAEDGVLDAKDSEEAIQRMLQFVELVDGEILRETEVWAKEFQSSLSELESMVRAERDRSEPGSLRVTVDGAADVTDLRVLVDGVPGPLPAGKRCTIPRVPPGAHSIEVHGRRENQPVGDAAIVHVGPDAIGEVTLDLST